MIRSIDRETSAELERRLLVPVLGARGRQIDHTQGFEHAALRQIAGAHLERHARSDRDRVGSEAVEQPVVAILRQIHVRGRGIDGDRLVVEAAHRLDRHRLDERFGARIDFEHVPVALAHQRCAVVVHGILLAGHVLALSR